MQTVSGAFVDHDGTMHPIGSGQFVSASRTQRPPVLHLPESAHIDFVITVVDWDAPFPDNPVAAPLVHWIELWQQASDRDGVPYALVPWLPMRPPAESPPHLYEVLVWQARQPVDRKPLALRSRANFPLRNWASANRLELLAVGTYYSK